MRRAYDLLLSILFFLISCQPQPTQTIILIDGDQIHQLITTERVPAALMEKAGMPLKTGDVILLNGQAVAPNQAMSTAQSYTLQVRHAAAMTVNGKIIQTAELTVGEALSKAGAKLYASDQINPIIQTVISGPLKVTDIASRTLTAMADGKPLQIRTSAATVGEALAEAGIPLMGLDASQPSENNPIPSNGQIQLTNISESILLSEKSIPFKTDYQQSANIQLDQQQILQAGQAGLSVSRMRIIYQDGQEVSRENESATVVRPPQDQIIGYGTKVVINTVTVGGVQIQYWRAIQMYATSYSPCRSAPDRCYSGTSSGKPVQKGVVAVKYSLYLALEGQRLFIPGYGLASIEDVCGGCVGKPWVDLGYSDSDYQEWGQWVTVYFLAPAPATIPPIN
jgi:resuscitation-promoting factor RpfB